MTCHYRTTYASTIKHQLSPSLQLLTCQSTALIGARKARSFIWANMGSTMRSNMSVIVLQHMIAIFACLLQRLLTIFVDAWFYPGFMSGTHSSLRNIVILVKIFQLSVSNIKDAAIVWVNIERKLHEQTKSLVESIMNCVDGKCGAVRVGMMILKIWNVGCSQILCRWF